MIKKTINYCWFGKSELDEKSRLCIESWKKIMPDYEIKRWDESNYDVNKNSFVKEAYENKKWAFVSDYARLDIIYNYGGIYLDTDVEVIKTFDDLLEYELGEEVQLFNAPRQNPRNCFETGTKGKIVEFFENGLMIETEKGEQISIYPPVVVCKCRR